MASAARMPMIATTIMSSTSVKPRAFFLSFRIIMLGSFVLGGLFRDAKGHPTRRFVPIARARYGPSFGLVLSVNTVGEIRTDEVGVDPVAVAIGDGAHDVP